MMRKKALLAILEKLHCRYMNELKLEAAGYRDIRTYFVKLTGSAEEAASGAASRLNFKTSRVVEQLIPDLQSSCLLFN
jgi:hypothetical protein